MPGTAMTTHKQTRRKLLIAVTTTLTVLALSLCGWVYKAKTQHDMNMKLLGAVRKNDIEAVQSLLAHGTDPNIRDVPDKHLSLWQQIRYAFRWDKQESYDLFAPQKPTALELALTSKLMPGDISYVPRENVPIVKALLEAGAHPDDTTENDSNENETPLMSAVRNNWLQTVRLLLDHGANPLAHDTEGRIPIHFISDELLGVVQGDQLAIARLLVERGNDVNAVADNGGTPLMTSIRAHCNTSVILFLLSKGANVNARSHEGESALLVATDSEYEAAAKVLVERGAEVNVTDEFKNTPLHICVDRGLLPIGEMLLAHSAKVEAINNGGDTPLTMSVGDEYLSDSDTQGMVKLLIRHGADVNHRNKDGDTPLSLARKQNMKGTVRVLLEAGAKR